MVNLLKQFLIEWNSGKNQRTKLQQAYFLIIILLAVAAGFLSLLNGDFGRLLMIIAAFVAAVYICNGVAWALLDAFVTPLLPKRDIQNTEKALGLTGLSGRQASIAMVY